MAIIDGREPPSLLTLPRLLSTVVVQINVPDDAEQDEIDEAARRIGASVGHRLRPYFSPPHRLRPPTRAQYRMRAFVAFKALSPFADRIAARLAARPDVVTAYKAAGPQPPPSSSETSVSLTQDYLNDAKTGIGARWAWTNAPGTPVGFVDVEQGWGLDHADFAGAVTLMPGGINKYFRGHGSAALGIVSAAQNGFGGTGIGLGSGARVMSEWLLSGHNPADAIHQAAEDMLAGDVMLVEAQVVRKAGGSWVKMPPEVEAGIFLAMQHARDRGVVVIEPAGNGSYDLDGYVDLNGTKSLDRSSWPAGSDFDSGAIIVAAAGSVHPYVKVPLSNKGSRVDCFAWGKDVQTSGDGKMDGHGYTTNFKNTSAASAIVAGAAVRLQAWANGNGAVLAPDVVRSLLSDPGLNTTSQHKAADKIGVMPDLKAIITAAIGAA